MFLRSLIAGCVAVLLICTLALAQAPTPAPAQKERPWQDLVRIFNSCFDKNQATCPEFEEFEKALGGEAQIKFLMSWAIQSCLVLTLDNPPASLKVTGIMNEATAQSIVQYAEEADIPVNNDEHLFALFLIIFKDCEAHME